MISQAAGSSGRPSRGHCCAAASSASWTASSHGVEVAVAPDERAEDLRHQRAQQVLGGRTAGHRSEAASCMIGFTSTRPNRAKGTLAAISRARSSESTSMMSKLPRYSLVSM